MPESARAARGLSQSVRGHRIENGFFDTDDHQLCDTVPSAHRVVLFGVVVDQQHLQFAPIARVDEAGCVQAGDTVTQGQSTAREDQTCVSLRDGHGKTGGDQGPPTPGGQHDVPARPQVGPGVAGSSVGGQWQLRVELVEGHTEHRWTLLTSARLGPGPVACPPMLAWMDLEMTGLDPSRHVIVEIASLVTDDDLTIVAEGPDLVVHATPAQLAEMDDFVTAMHTRSGLLEAMAASTLTLEEAGAQTLEFLKLHIPEPRTVPLAGNSIGTDRRFLATQLPEIEEYLHYRSVDVSTLKELCRRWYPALSKGAPDKKGGHRALQDIQESVAELAFYRSAIFIPTPTPATPDP